MNHVHLPLMCGWNCKSALWSCMLFLMLASLRWRQGKRRVVRQCLRFRGVLLPRNTFICVSVGCDLMKYYMGVFFDGYRYTGGMEVGRKKWSRCLRWTEAHGVTDGVHVLTFLTKWMPGSKNLWWTNQCPQMLEIVLVGLWYDMLYLWILQYLSHLVSDF